MSNIDELSNNSIKKSEQQYYATKHFLYGTLLTICALICTAYWYVTPVLIDSKNSKLETKIDKLLEVLNSQKK